MPNRHDPSQTIGQICANSSENNNKSSNELHCKSFCAKSGHSVGKFESRYLILCVLHLARPLSECVIGMGKIGSYHYLCFANSYKIVKLCEGSAQNDGPDSFVCSLVIMSVDTTHSL